MLKYNKVAVAAFLAVGLVGAAGASCWKPQEKALWANDELDNVVTLSFRNAVTCAPLAYADVTIGDKVRVKTDGAGLIRFPAPEGVDDAAVPLEVRAEGYYNSRGYLYIAFNLPLGNRFLVSPRMNVDKARFVLSWGDGPKDLDLHLVGPDFHISYQDMRNVPNEARLDRDSMAGYGPETITANRLRHDRRYELWVHNYSNEAPLGRPATVSVYLSDGTQTLVEIPKTTKRWVKIADIINAELRLTVTPSDRGPGGR